VTTRGRRALIIALACLGWGLAIAPTHLTE
jgi:hypothetical protein